jgi:hypothetical protein
MGIKNFLKENIDSAETLAEAAMKSADIGKIKNIIQNYKFLSLRDPLKSAGFKVDFVFSPVAHYQVSKGPSKVAIMNKKYADKALFTVGDTAVELM